MYFILILNFRIPLYKSFFKIMPKNTESSISFPLLTFFSIPKVILPFSLLATSLHPGMQIQILFKLLLQFPKALNS